MAALKFLTHTATSVESKLLGSSSALAQLCEKIIVPAMMLREDDEELFEMNYIEYIRR